jgi:hypothetical protein
MRADDTTAGAYTSIDGHKWMEAAEAYAIEQRFNIVLESAMRDPRDFEEPAARLRAAGYRVEVPVVAVHESLSRLGALDRYLRQVEAFGQGPMIDARPPPSTPTGSPTSCSSCAATPPWSTATVSPPRASGPAPPPPRRP